MSVINFSPLIRERRTDLISHFYEHSTTIEVGPEHLQFSVHKNLLCKTSTFFKHAFDSDFIEARSNRLELVEESVKEFAVFLRWLYSGKIPLPSVDQHIDFSGYKSEVQKAVNDLLDTQQSNTELTEPLDASLQSLSITDSTESLGTQVTGPDDSTKEEEEDVAHEMSFTSRTHRMLIDLYLFADRRNIPNFGNDIITLLAQKREQGWPYLSADPDLVQQAYDCLPADSGLCRFLVDEAAWCWTDEIDGLEHLDAYPSEFNAALVRAMLHRNKKHAAPRPSWRHDLCVYHQHENQEEATMCSSKLSGWYRLVGSKSGMEPVGLILSEG